MGTIGALGRAVVVVLFILACAFAQNPTATIVGTIRDATGGFVAGAEVRVRNVETNDAHVVRSTPEGEFTIPNLPAGKYEAMVQHPGFHTVRQTGIELQIEQTARLEFKLEVGSISESVEVTASAPL